MRGWWEGCHERLVGRLYAWAGDDSGALPGGRGYESERRVLALGEKDSTSPRQTDGVNLGRVDGANRGREDGINPRRVDGTNLGRGERGREA